jgi:protein tyrosine phosphatase (PTP) superfamily phosphohydrolase (DUF442 family)
MTWRALLVAGVLIPFASAQSTPAPTSTATPAISSPSPAPVRLHNVIEVAPGLLSGSAPKSDADFAELARMGVRVVLSVDGAAPDVAAAKAHGLRYVHVPVGYHGIDRPEQLALARALRDLPKPIYLHCHHGRHRGPAAAAVAAVVLGEITNADAEALLAKAGTSPYYTGLYACVREASRADEGELAAAPVDLPEIAPLPGFVTAMAEMQERYDHLVAIRDAGWVAPADHPDLVPAAEASRLRDLLRGAQDDEYKRDKPGEFGAMLEDSWQRAQAFEDALNRGASADELKSRLESVGASCKSCHEKFRDRRGR